jgi:3-hydroxyisobutyrate dehydrogenase-like beta-hydroxyacid dehydrogenase
MDRNAAILYPGEMGCAVAKVLLAGGWRVSTHLEGPSLMCRGDVEAAEIEDLGSLVEVLTTADLVISLVPPAAALEVAQTVARAAGRVGVGRRPLYLDANSVAPETVQAVAAVLDAAGVEVVDGSFVGSARDLGSRTRLYLSGPRAVELAAALPATFQARVVDVAIGAASGFKLAFAGFNKGLVALFLEVMTAGEAAGEPDALRECLSAFYPGTIETLERLLPSYPRHAARRADEMDELAAWLTREGQDPAWALAAREVFVRFAALGLDAERAWTLDEILAALTRADLSGDASAPH